MPGSSGVRAGKAFVELHADDSQLVRGLSRVQGRLRAFGAGITQLGTRFLALGAGIVTPLLAATRQFAATGDALNKMSARTGVAVESLSSLGFAAEQSGADVESLERGLTGMARFLLQASRDGEAATETLGALGLAMTDLQGLSPEDQFKLLADRLAAIEDPTERAALAMQVFGRSGQGLIPLLSQGADGIAALQREAEELGIVLSTEDAQAAADLTDALNRLWNVIKAGSLAIGSALAPMLESLVEQLTGAAMGVRDFIRENADLVRTTFQVGAGLAAVGVALVATGTAVKLLASGIGALITIYRALTAAAALFGVTSASAWAAATLGISVLITGLVAVGAALFALHRETGVLDPLIESGQRLYAAVEPLVPLFELALAGAIELLAELIETLIVPQLNQFVFLVEAVAAGLEVVAEKLANLAGLGPVLMALGIVGDTVGSVRELQGTGSVFGKGGLKAPKVERDEDGEGATDDATETVLKNKIKELSKLADGGLAGELDSLQRDTSAGRSEGTFSAMAGRIFGAGGSVEEKQLTALESIDSNTKKISKREGLTYAD